MKVETISNLPQTRCYICHKTSSFIKLNEQSLNKIKEEGVSEDIITRLEDLKNISQTSEDNFFNVLKETIGQEHAFQYKSVILKHTHRIEIDKICHHCAQAICNNETPTLIPEGRGIENPEFSDLNLEQLESDKDIIHCKDCIHHVQSYQWMRQPAIIVGVIGLIIAVLGFGIKSLGTILVGFFGIITSISWYIIINKKHEKNYEQARLNNRPPFPVVPNIGTISVTEYSNGHISLNAEGKYTSQFDQTRGKLSLSFQFIPRDRDRLDLFLEKYKLSADTDIPFHAGFALLEDAPNLQFEEPNVFLKRRPNIISLIGTTGEQPFLCDDDRRENNYTIRFPYTVLEDVKEENLPIQIIPTFVQEGSLRAIDLILQVSPKASNSLRSGAIRIEELVLYVPQRLSKVVMVQPSAVTANISDDVDNSEPMQKITWKGLDIGSGGRWERNKRLYIRFENKIDPSTKFHGKLRIYFSGNLSQLKNIKFFYPWGIKRPENISIQKQTYLDVDFSLDLYSLRFQEVISETNKIVHKGIVPNHNIISKLTDDITNIGVYVKRVIENPARTDKAGAHITNRYWDMAGRHYEGVYPIDFHLVITGEEIYESPKDSKIQVDISVQGIVTDDEMRNRVKQLRDQLTAVIENTLNSLPEFNEETASYSKSEDDVSETTTSEQIRHIFELLNNIDNKLDEVLLYRAPL